MCYGFLRGDFIHGQRININRINGDIDNTHQHQSPDQRARHVALRIFDLTAHKSDVNPAIVGPEDGDQRYANAGDD